MNTRMYENPVTQDNLALLRRYGWEIVEPASGRLACGAVGKGKMPEPEELLETVLHALSHAKDMEGLKVLVTAGPTQEPLDPVRYLTNHSTGKWVTPSPGWPCSGGGGHPDLWSHRPGAPSLRHSGPCNLRGGHVPGGVPHLPAGRLYL